MMELPGEGAVRVVPILHLCPGAFLGCVHTLVNPSAARVECIRHAWAEPGAP